MVGMGDSKLRLAAAKHSLRLPRQRAQRRLNQAIHIGSHHSALGHGAVKCAAGACARSTARM